MEQSNREVLLTVMVEDAEGLANIDAIAAVDGIDLIAPPLRPEHVPRVGGQPDHPKLVAAMERIIAATRKAGKAGLALPLGHPLYPRTLAENQKLGTGLLLCGTPPQTRLLRSFTQELTEIRRALGTG